MARTVSTRPSDIGRSGPAPPRVRAERLRPTAFELRREERAVEEEARQPEEDHQAELARPQVQELEGRAALVVGERRGMGEDDRDRAHPPQRVEAAEARVPPAVARRPAAPER